jgi:hypothetical protein
MAIYILPLRLPVVFTWIGQRSDSPAEQTPLPRISGARSSLTLTKRGEIMKKRQPISNSKDMETPTMLIKAVFVEQSQGIRVAWSNLVFGATAA